MRTSPVCRSIAPRRPLVSLRSRAHGTASQPRASAFLAHQPHCRARQTEAWVPPNPGPPLKSHRAMELRFYRAHPGISSAGDYPPIKALASRLPRPVPPLYPPSNPSTSLWPLAAATGNLRLCWQSISNMLVLRLPWFVESWGGGTGIGASLVLAQLLPEVSVRRDPT
jgi:hypothetical protein